MSQYKFGVGTPPLTSLSQNVCLPSPPGRFPRFARGAFEALFTDTAHENRLNIDRIALWWSSGGHFGAAAAASAGHTFAVEPSKPSNK